MMVTKKEMSNGQLEQEVCTDPRTDLFCAIWILYTGLALDQLEQDICDRNVLATHEGFLWLNRGDAIPGRELSRII